MAVREIEVAELRRRGADAGLLLNVRTPEEFAAGHLPGAVNFPLDALDAAAAGFAGRSVVTVCRSGNRSATAARVLDAAGARARSLAGGTEAWREAGLPVEGGAAADTD